MDSEHEEPTREQPQEQPRRLTRSSDDRVLAGVCGGLGRYFGIDPVIFRIGAVALVFLGGAGLFLYLAALLLVPSDKSPGEGPRGIGQRALAIVGVVLLVIAAAAIFSHGPFHFWIAWPIGLLLLVGLGIWWLVTAERAGDSGGQDAARRLLLGVVVLIGSFALAIGGAWLTGIGGGTIAGIAIIAAGGALAIGALRGGARWLILPALALALPVSVVSAAGIDLHGGAGDRHYDPTTASEVKSSYRVGAGRLVVDLRDAKLPAGDRALKLRVGVGQAVLIVPPDVCVATQAKIGMGQVQAFDRSNGGIDVDWSDQPLAAPANARVVLNANVGMGQVLITHTDDGVYDHYRGFRQKIADQRNTGCEG
jgi:phage shock protein PspC (stress-responsive transcriptional regulator)